MGTKARILATVLLDGIAYQPNQIVDLPPAVAKQLAADGQVDPHKDAVAYCLKELGAEVIVHAVPVVEEPAAPVVDSVVPTDPPVA